MSRTRPPVPDAFTVDVERLTHGPDALAHHDGCVVFVPLAAPGDRMDVRVEARRPGYVRARPTRLVAAGPARATPFCPVAQRCGGCGWQHVGIEAQREAKRAVVAEQLARLGGLRDVEVRPVVAADDRAYRSRVTLAVRGGTVGYHPPRSHDVVAIDACPIATGPVSGAIPLAAAWVRDDAPPVASLTLAAGPGGVVVVADVTVPLDAAMRARGEAWWRAMPALQGLVLRTGRTRLVLGDPTIHLPLEADLHLEVPADVFSQVNPALNPALVAAVVEHAAVGTGTPTLDLYGGAGNFALPLGRRGAAVHCIETAPLAVEAGRVNAARLGLANVAFERADVAAALTRLERESVEVVVLDPPRHGAAAALGALARLRPARIVYVSCDPATLARDARTLAAAGYRLTLACPFDLFPHTPHVETVAVFGLT